MEPLEYESFLAHHIDAVDTANPLWHLVTSAITSSVASQCPCSSEPNSTMTSKYKNSDVDQRENAKDKPKVPLREKIKVLGLIWKEKNPMLRLLTFKEQ